MPFLDIGTKSQLSVEEISSVKKAFAEGLGIKAASILVENIHPADDAETDVVLNIKISRSSMPEETVDYAGLLSSEITKEIKRSIGRTAEVYITLQDGGGAIEGKTY